MYELPEYSVSTYVKNTSEQLSDVLTNTLSKSLTSPTSR